MRSNHRKSGFTIVEVLIILAIASIILVIVLLAVPALQRNSRNTQRRHDVAATLAFIEEARLTNNGRLPNSCNTSQHWCFLRDAELIYYDNNSSDNIISYHNRISLGPFNEDGVQLDPGDPMSRERVQIRSWAKCSGSLLTGEDARKENLAAQFVIETASGGSLQCIEI